MEEGTVAFLGGVKKGLFVCIFMHVASLLQALAEATAFYSEEEPEMLQASPSFAKMGRQLITKFPSLARPGIHEWSSFTRVLSGRLRSHRYNSDYSC